MNLKVSDKVKVLDVGLPALNGRDGVITIAPWGAYYQDGDYIVVLFHGDDYPSIFSFKEGQIEKIS